MREVEVSEGISVRVEEQYDMENESGAVVWDAALVLAHFLIYCQENSAPQGNMQGKAVIEVGSGTGVVGLVAAALGAKPVLLTDLPHLVTHMQTNIQLNSMEHTASAYELEWGNMAHISSVLKRLALARTSGDPEREHGSAAASSSPRVTEVLSKMHPDVILGSDLLYKASELDSLFFTLALLSGPATTVLLSYEDRAGIEAFHDVAKAHGFVERKVPGDLLHPDWRSEDIHIAVMTKCDPSL